MRDNIFFAINNDTNITIIYIIIVTPVALIKKCSGFDPMKSRLWKNGKDSVFTEHDRAYSSSDLEKPF